MFEKFSDRARKVMALANQEAQRYNHEYIGTEHILLGLLKEGSGVGANVLKNLEIDLRKARLEVEKLVKHGPDMVTLGKLPQTPRAKKVIEFAIEEARVLNHNYVGTEHLLLGLIREADGIAAQVLMKLGLKLEEVREEVLNLLGAGIEDEPPAPKKKSKTPALDAFGRDLNELARNGRLEDVAAWEREIESVIHVLCRRQKNNPVLVAEGLAKTAIVEAVAQRIESGEIPEILADRRIVVLDLANLAVGTQRRGQVGERVKAVVHEARLARDVILFIDELHTMAEGVGAEDAMEASNVLRPALGRGEIQCIGATTLDQYNRYIEEDGALGRLFQRIIVEQPTSKDTTRILCSLRDRYEAHHRVQITDAAINAAVELSGLYMPDAYQPDQAIEIIDEAGAAVRFKTITKPPRVVDLEREIERLLLEKDEAVKDADYERAAELRSRAEDMRSQKEDMSREWRERIKGTDGIIDENEIYEVVSQATGIAVEKVRGRESGGVRKTVEIAASGLAEFERLQSDSILNGAEVKITQGLGFVLLPHTPEFQALFDAAIRPAMTANGLNALKADDLYRPGSILAQVWQYIRSAEVVVADVSGKNPNVIYELGLCFGLHRCPILLVQDPGALPFNLRSLRYIEYEAGVAGIPDLKKKLTLAIHEFLYATRRQPLALAMPDEENPIETT